jgi:aryl-alcohol dehydrogenase-like predicted oxidoreductase
MITRRDYLKLSLALGAAPSARSLLWADDAPLSLPLPLMMRPIPSTGETLPVIGLGSSATFAEVARSEDIAALREVFSALLDKGGTVFDTAPAYGASEAVAGDIAQELGLTDRIFWATKLNVVPRGGNGADPAAARAQIEASFERIRKTPIDLIQVHNLADVPVQLGILKVLKAAGRIRYIGVTSTNPRMYDELIAVMRNEPLDFIGVDYAIDNLTAAETIFPLALERGIAVMVYVPFGRTRLWDKVRGQQMPVWAAEFDAHSWAQFFLKFVLAHPAVTVITPATSRAQHMVDNLGAALGRLPDAAMQRRMIELIEVLPA